MFGDASITGALGLSLPRYRHGLSEKQPNVDRPHFPLKITRYSLPPLSSVSSSDGEFWARKRQPELPPDQENGNGREQLFLGVLAK
jgi:hypothetical protein